jgi:NAD(P)-dependent dehydrogenase (short-subunit alcohol dehydrogenase family)
MTRTLVKRAHRGNAGAANPFERKDLMTSSPRVALVTGANKGIGLEIARQLAQQGISVLLGARNVQRGTDATGDLASDGLDVTFLHIDSCDQASVAAAAGRITSEHGRLDILVNNAGIFNFDDGAPGSVSLATVRATLETNFVGTLAVTQAMLPLVRAAAAGRIVNVSSALGSLTVNGDPTSVFYSARTIGYNASKAAVNMLTVQLAAELADTPIIVTSVSPGYVKTDLTGGAGVLTPAEAATTVVRYALTDDGALSGLFVNATGELPW